MAQDQGPATALVTGAGRRLGRAIALDLAAHGWSVGVHYHASAAEALSVVAEIEAKGGKAAAFAADLARSGAPEPLIESCIATLGPITCLINSAACYEWDDIQTLDCDTWQAHFDVNLRAPIFLAQALARRLPKGVSGNIINVIDQKVLRPDPDVLLLHHRQIGVVDRDANCWHKDCAADQGQCHCPGPRPAELKQSERNSRANATRPCSGAA